VIAQRRPVDYHIYSMRTQVKRIAIEVAGWTFIVLGIAGLFLPFLQGILFLLIGLFILSTQYAWAHRLLHRLRERFPKIAEQFDKAKAKAERWVSPSV
jgi:uncharacterized membrane protein YbaN (DUF454 family)